MHDSAPRLRVRAGKWAFTKEEGYGIASLLLDYDFIQDVFTSHRNGSILIYYDGDDESKQKIFNILAGITIDDLLKVGIDSGLNKRKMDVIIKEVKSAVRNYPTFAGQAEIPDNKALEDYANFVLLD